MVRIGSRLHCFEAGICLHHSACTLRLPFRPGTSLCRKSYKLQNQTRHAYQPDSLRIDCPVPSTYLLRTMSMPWLQQGHCVGNRYMPLRRMNLSIFPRRMLCRPNRNCRRSHRRSSPAGSRCKQLKIRLLSLCYTDQPCSWCTQHRCCRSHRCTGLRSIPCNPRPKLQPCVSPAGIGCTSTMRSDRYKCRRHRPCKRAARRQAETCEHRTQCNHSRPPFLCRHGTYRRRIRCTALGRKLAGTVPQDNPCKSPHLPWHCRCQVRTSHTLSVGRFQPRQCQASTDGRSPSPLHPQTSLPRMKYTTLFAPKTACACQQGKVCMPHRQSRPCTCLLHTGGTTISGRSHL